MISEYKYSRFRVALRFETPRTRLINYLFIAAKLGPSMGMVIYYFQMGEIERDKQLVSFYFRYHQCLQSHLYLNFNIPITGTILFKTSDALQGTLTLTLLSLLYLKSLF